MAQGAMHVFAHCENSYSALLLLGVGCARIAQGVCKCRMLRTQGMSCSAAALSFPNWEIGLGLIFHIIFNIYLISD